MVTAALYVHVVENQPHAVSCTREILTPDQAPSDNGSFPDAPISIDDVSSLICQVICTSPYKSRAANTLKAAFAAKDALDPPQRIDQLYVSLPSPDLQDSHRHYDATVTFDE